MKFLLHLLRQFISPSMRFELKNSIERLKELSRRLCIWRWEFVKLSFREGSAYKILYAGRSWKRKQAMALLGIDSNVLTNQLDKGTLLGVLVSEMPIPGALCVPQDLSTIVPLSQSLDEIVAGYKSELRRLICKNRINYSTRLVQDDADIDRINRDMLRPFVAARHGDDVVQLERRWILDIAQRYGHLVEVYSGNEAVACQLGFPFIRNEKRYWSATRWGYPEAVFSDRKRLREVNTINTYLELEWAHENGFDYYDMGLSLGSPDGGLLQWKKNRKGFLDYFSTHVYFYVRLPKIGAAQFLWDAPLFSIERDNLTLHLGVPYGLNEYEISTRYREMGFIGLYKVYLHSTRPLTETLIEKIRSFYALQKHPPIIECVIAE